MLILEPFILLSPLGLGATADLGGKFFSQPGTQPDGMVQMRDPLSSLSTCQAYYGDYLQGNLYGHGTVGLAI